MLKKIDRAHAFLQKQPLFRCPLCQTDCQLDNYSLACSKGHRFDLSKKGTIYFLKHQIQTEYTKAMFAPRGRMIRSGMYQPLIDLLAQWIKPDGMLLDAGCGEGSFLAELTAAGVANPKLGFDIAKEGVYLATDQPIDAFWCMADLTNLPFKAGSIDTLLTIFSPAHYQEFYRVLAPDGEVLKVVPQSGYLQELRQAFYPNDETKQLYSNEAVVDKFCASMTLLEQQRVTYTFDIPEAQRLDLLEMSPLEWGVSEVIKAQLQARPLEKITVDVEILRGKKK